MKVKEILNRNYKYNIDDEDYFEIFVGNVTTQIRHLLEKKLDRYISIGEENDAWGSRDYDLFDEIKCIINEVFGE